MTQDIQIKVEGAIQAVESFSNLLDRETAALKTSNYKEFANLQESKFVLAQAYQDAVLAFEEHLDAVKTLAETVKEKLRAAHARFQAAVKANQEALLNARKVAERMVNLIMDAAKRSVSDTPSYSAAGMQALSNKIPVHFKLNEVL